MYLLVDSFANSLGMRDWEDCGPTMGKKARLAQCGVDLAMCDEEGELCERCDKENPAQGGKTMNQVRTKMMFAVLTGTMAVVVLFLFLTYDYSVRAATPVVDDAANHTFSIHTATANALTCPEATTLEDLITCIVGQMPGRGSEGFIVPTSTVRSAWRIVAGQMLDGQCDDIVLPAGLGGVYSASTFIDVDNGQNYCVLMEILDQDDNGVVDRGWGTFIVNPDPSRELSIQIAHPIHDIGTAAQGIGVFKGSNSRSFLMAGAHRYANYVCSACQHPECSAGEAVPEPQDYLEADVAHNVENLFQPAVEELLEFYDGIGTSFAALQFHGMGTSSCPGVDVYMTYGLSLPPAVDDKILELQSNLMSRNPTWTVPVPGDSPSCGLHGSTNVPGRFLNNVAVGDVCTTYASGYSERFFHIEQKIDRRSADNWVDAINETWAPRLTVTKDASSDMVPAGVQLIYTICVTNTGDTLLHPVITDTPSVHVAPTGVLTWTPAAIAPDDVWTQTVAVTVEMGYTGPLTNAVRVTTDEGATGTYACTVHVIPEVSFSSTTYSVDEGAGHAVVTVTLNGAAGGLTVTVGYATSNGTAIAGSDYAIISDTLTFTPGVTSRTFVVPITQDELDEYNETIVLTLFSADNATVGGTNPATLTIVDDDDPPTAGFSTVTYIV